MNQQKKQFVKPEMNVEELQQALFQAVEEKYGVVDVLFNNAAYSLSKTLWDTTEAVSYTHLTLPTKA